MPKVRDIVNRLTDMKVDEISLVDRGANQLAKVLISKRLDDVDKMSPTSSGVHHDKPMGDDEKKRKKKKFAYDEDGNVIVEGDLSKADDDEDDLAALLEAVAARRKRKRKRVEEPDQPLGADELEAEEEDTEPEDEDEDPFAGLGDEEAPEDGDEDAFAEDAEDELDHEGEDLEGAPEDALDEEAALENELDDEEPMAMPGDLPAEVSEYIGLLERTVDQMERTFKEQSQGEVTKTARKDQEEVAMSDTDVSKSGDDLTTEELSFLEELSKSFEAGDIDADEVISKALEEVTKFQTAATEATEMAKSERELRLNREFIAKVADEYPHLPVDAAEFGPVLKAVEEALTEEQYEILGKALAANEAISKSIADGKVSPLTEVGKRGGSTPASSEVDSLADEMVQKGEAKSHEEAVAKLYEQRPELYDDYLSDNEAQTR